MGDGNADNADEEIHIHPPPEVSVTRHSPTESVVQALVADQSVLSTLSQAILSVIKQDLLDHAIDRSRAEKAAAPVGQSAEQSAVECGPNRQSSGNKKTSPYRCCCD